MTTDCLILRLVEHVSLLTYLLRGRCLGPHLYHLKFCSLKLQRRYVRYLLRVSQLNQFSILVTHDEVEYLFWHPNGQPYRFLICQNHPLCHGKRLHEIERAKKFFDVLLLLKISSVVLKMATKLRPQCGSISSSESKSGRFSGMVTTVLRLSSDE